MMGLARAFLAGGTRNVLATLWPIEDQAARRVLESFHQDLQEGFRPSEALTRAQRELRKEGVGIEDWAAFRLSGRD
jgi:CHAT domain-containing protein